MHTTRGLIVDSNCDMANFLEIVLGLAGLRCETAYSPQAALDFLSSNEPELIFVHLDLGADDRESQLLSYIRSNPRFDRTRLILLTGFPALAEPFASLADLVLPNTVQNTYLRRLTSRLMMMEVKPHEFRDPQTGLCNLKFFHTRLELAFERARRRPDFLFTLQALELTALEQPGSQPLSDAEWEQALSIIAGRWLARFRQTSIFGRGGRRQVLGLFEDLKGPQDVQIILERLNGELALPVDLGERSLRLTACSGGVTNLEGYASAQDLLKGALQALENSRQAGQPLPGLDWVSRATRSCSRGLGDASSA
jgi:GGDEF domain-containing protein